MDICIYTCMYLIWINWAGDKFMCQTSEYIYIYMNVYTYMNVNTVCGTVSCNVLHCHAVAFSVLQCVAVCCSVL